MLAPRSPRRRRQQDAAAADWHYVLSILLPLLRWAVGCTESCAARCACQPAWPRFAQPGTCADKQRPPHTCAWPGCNNPQACEPGCNNLNPIPLQGLWVRQSHKTRCAWITTRLKAAARRRSAPRYSGQPPAEPPWQLDPERCLQAHDIKLGTVSFVSLCRPDCLSTPDCLTDQNCCYLRCSMPFVHCCNPLAGPQHAALVSKWQ